MKNIESQKGQILIYVIVFTTISIYLLSSLVSWAILNIKAGNQAIQRELAIEIAEAGTDYYRWHLAHAPKDYQDGAGAEGPYIHVFKDKNNTTIGNFTLTITPPLIGSTLVRIKSTGETIENPNIKRSITTRLAKPSIAKYSVAANAVMRFGEGTEVFGPITSNGGIRFDGVAHNIISSAVSSYDDPDHDDHDYEYGVHTHVGTTDPLPPTPVPARPDVFKAGRQFPVTAIDFSGITSNLSQMKTDAQTDGFYRSDSGGEGYHIVFKTDNTFDLYQVTRLINASHDCYRFSHWGANWGTWSIRNETFINNYSIPSNGILFFEDHLFVDGKIDNSRVVVVAASFPETPTTWKSITINENLLYTNYDGTDSIGLIAQGDVNAGMVSADTMRIDAALIAQNGRVGRYYYSSDCYPHSIKSSITLYGMIATNKRYGFAYGDNTGYTIRKLIYDANLLYGPPPSFPLTSEQYETLSWEEIK